MVKSQVIELGFGLACEWVMTHMRVVLEVIHERILKKDMY